MFLQRTLKKRVIIEGIGLHTGEPTTLSFGPAPADTGVYFVRADLPGRPSVPVLAQHVQATAYATTLGNEFFSISTVEHCLSSLTALQIDNAIIELSGPEIPICDGSAIVFYEELKKVGTVEQEAPRHYLFIQKPVYVGNHEKHAYVIPYNGLRITCTVDFPHPSIGQQHMDIDVNQSTFENEIARARTFGFLKDVEALRARGLARGGSLSNAIVLDDKKILNPEGLRFANEFVRHKILDAIGDLMTLGRPLMGHLVLYKAGHDLMNQLALHIMKSDGFKIVELGGEMPSPSPFEVPFSRGPFEPMNLFTKT